MKSLYWLSTPILLIALQNAKADINYPDFSEEPISIGRVWVYPSIKGIQWMTPTAFNVNFDCSSSGRTSVCGIQIFNSLNTNERSQIQALSSTFKNIMAFRDIDLIVEGPVMSQFSGLPASLLTTSPVYLNNLAMGPHALQASTLGRVDSSEADRLNTLFNTSGLGTFSVQYRIKGEEVYQFLKLNRPDCLKNLLSDLSEYKVTTLRSKIKETLQSCDLSSKGLEPDEVKIETTDAILRNFYQSNHHGRYTSKGLTALKTDSWVILDESSETLQKTCTATVNLDSSAAVQLNCENAK